MVKLAVLLSSYNGEKYISCQIDSILNQAFETPIEIHLFVRDDGSTDGTILKLQEYESNYKNVHVIYGENVGFVKSFFSLLIYVKNNYNFFDFYALSDQDDRWDEDKLQTALLHSIIDEPFLYEATTRITDSNLNFVRMDCIQKKPVTFYNSAIQTFFPGHTFVFNSKLMSLIKDDIKCEELYAHDAFIHNLAIICGKVYFDNTPHNDYRQHERNVEGVSKRKNSLSWIKNRKRRAKKGEAIRYSKQIRYYLEYFDDYLSYEEKKELKLFFNRQKNFWTRLFYAFIMKFYRQSFKETLLFKLFYILGGYKI